MINPTAPLSTPGVGQSLSNRLGRKIRILVVDDSVVTRRIICQILNDDPALEVVGYAANGALGLQRAAELKPDVITLDIEMPEMDGLTTVKRLREASSKAYIIMCSALTSRGGSATLDALMLGANDYVTKPSKSGSMDTALTALRHELVPKIKQFFEQKKAATIAKPAPLQSIPAQRDASHLPAMPIFSSAAERKVVAIGVSTGGPTALMEILPLFPASFPLPVVIVQHMPPLFTKLLADRLGAQSSFEVVEAANGMVLKRGRVLIAPGDFHMRLQRSANEVAVRLDQGPRENSCRPAVDVLFRSVAEVYGGGAIGVVLTGMGQDGLRGVEQLKSKGAYIIAQDQGSSVVWGMPGAIVEAGLADSVLSLRAVVPEILRRAAR